MNDLEQMMKSTVTMVQEAKKQERVWSRILHVLRLAEAQQVQARESILLMLEYEKCRQKMSLQERQNSQTLSKDSVTECENEIRLYEEAVKLLTQQKGV